MENTERFYDSWLEYRDNTLPSDDVPLASSFEEPVVKSYESKVDIDNTLMGTYIRQALRIRARCGSKITVLLSGGVESHSVALAFLNAMIPFKAVTFDFIYEDNHNLHEMFYSSAFCEQHHIQQHIVTEEYTAKKFKPILLEYYNEYCVVFAGNLQRRAINRYHNEHPDEILVTGRGNLGFQRDGDICTGNLGLPLIDKVTIPFFAYSPLIFKHYQYLHETDPLLQFPKRFEAKNLGHTLLNLPMRAKKSGGEAFYQKNNNNKSTIIDFGHQLMTPGSYSNRRVVEYILTDGNVSNINSVLGNTPRLDVHALKNPLSSLRSHLGNSDSRFLNKHSESPQLYEFKTAIGEQYQ
jgi:hypothetical protein